MTNASIVVAVAECSITIEPHHVGVDTGLWCESCSLPSVVRHRFAFTLFGGVVVFAYGYVEGCDQCGAVTTSDQSGDTSHG